MEKARNTVLCVGKQGLSRRHYWTSRCTRSYYARHIYGHQALYPRLLRLRAASELQASKVDPGIHLHGRSARLASSSRDSKCSKDKEPPRQSRDEEEDFREQWRHIRSQYGSFMKLFNEDREKALEEIHKWIEKDPYQALFGHREGRGVWNPWAGFWTWGVHSRSRHEPESGESATGRVPKETESPEQPLVKEKKAPVQPIITGVRNEVSPATAASVDRGRPSSQNQMSDHGAEEFMIDPITLRKVPRVRPEISASPAASPQQQTEPVHPDAQGIEISVRKFKPSIPLSDLGKEEIEALSPTKAEPIKLAGFASQPWLVREGFKPAPYSSRPIKSALAASSVEGTPSHSSKIEPALNRLSSLKGKAQPALVYSTPKDNNEDIDMLRARDVRAASGYIKRKAIPSTAAAEKRREKLEEDFTKAQTKHAGEVNTVLAARFAPQNGESSNKRKKGTIIPQSSDNGQAKEFAHLVKSAVAKVGDTLTLKDNKSSEKLQDLCVTLLRILKASENIKREQETRFPILESMLEEEIRTVKVAFDKFENRHKIGVPAKGDEAHKAFQPATTTLSERLTAEDEARKQRDKTLVREIRNIYEEKYGAINTDHRQPETSEASESKSASQISNTTPEPSIKAQQSSSSDVLPESTPRVVQELPTSVEVPQATLKHTPLSQAQNNEAAISQKQCLTSLKQQTRDEQLPFGVSSGSSTGAQMPAKSRSSSENFDSAATARQTEPVRYVYRLLAMDRLKQTVVSTTTSSTLFQTPAPLRSASDILTHLDHPYKYFDHMGTLEAQGYELVAGTRNLLVYRKQTESSPKTQEDALSPVKPPSRAAPAPAPTVTPSSVPNHPTPTFQSTGHFQSSSSKPEQEEQPSDVEQLAKSLKPWREEPVFSGRATPRKRFLRAYERAQRAKSATEERIAAQDRLGEAVHSINARRPWSQPRDMFFDRIVGKFLKSLGAVSTILILLWIVGAWQDAKLKREKEEREQEAERARQRKLKESSWRLH